MLLMFIFSLLSTVGGWHVIVFFKAVPSSRIAKNDLAVM